MPTDWRHQKGTSLYAFWTRWMLHIHFKKLRLLVVILISMLMLVVFLIACGGMTAYCADVKPVISNICPSEKTLFTAKLNYSYLDLLEEKYDFSEKLIYESAVTKIAIIVPYRKRENHLAIFLINMHKFLRAQGISYSIFVINQVDDNKFNRGGLLNAGFKEASKLTSNDCFFFHDVDLIPESGQISYCCSPITIIHYASAMSSWDWRMPYCGFHGGVVAATRLQFIKANGFANRFWGWGGEDDEFSKRVNASGQKISHLSERDGRFYMFEHERDAGNEPDPERVKKLKETKEKWKTDGLNSLNYTLIAIEQRRFYTEIQVKF